MESLLMNYCPTERIYYYQAIVIFINFTYCHFYIKQDIFVYKQYSYTYRILLQCKYIAIHLSVGEEEVETIGKLWALKEETRIQK